MVARAHKLTPLLHAISCRRMKVTVAVIALSTVGVDAFGRPAFVSERIVGNPSAIDSSSYLDTL